MSPKANSSDRGEAAIGERCRRGWRRRAQTEYFLGRWGAGSGELRGRNGDGETGKGEGRTTGKEGGGAHSVMERRWDGGGDGMFGGTPAYRSPTLDRLMAPPGEKSILEFWYFLRK